jgi:hypothetical protein
VVRRGFSFGLFFPLLFCVMGGFGFWCGWWMVWLLSQDGEGDLEGFFETFSLFASSSSGVPRLMYGFGKGIIEIIEEKGPTSVSFTKEIGQIVPSTRQKTYVSFHPNFYQDYHRRRRNHHYPHCSIKKPEALRHTEQIQSRRRPAGAPKATKAV